MTSLRGMLITVTEEQRCLLPSRVIGEVSSALTLCSYLGSFVYVGVGIRCDGSIPADVSRGMACVISCVTPGL